MSKETFRQKMLSERLLIETKDIEIFSSIIQDKLLELDCVQKSECIMAYYSYKNEPNLLAFMQACLDIGKCVALPCVVEEGKLIAVDYHEESIMKSNIYGIPEPVIQNESEQEQPDVVIVPGIAFDKNLNRIGFGGGYYDRYLKDIDAVKIGVCFDCQIVDNMDTQAHDIAMDIIVTERRVIGVE